MSITLKNGIPLLYFKCETPSAAIWFTKCGDCLDSYFGPAGLSHMLEHIYVTSDDEFYTNGATFSSAVSFLVINNKKIKPLMKMYEFINSWFFEGDKLKDLIANHSIEDRIQELNRETGLKALQYGESVSIAESLKTNNVTVFSKFDESFSTEEVKQALYRILDYMLDPSRIIIAIGGKHDNRSKLVDVFNPTFGQLKPSKIKINTSSHHLSTIFKGAKKEDVFLFNFMQRQSVESSIIVPVKNNSFMLTHTAALHKLSTNNGTVVAINTLFDIINNEYKFFLEVRVSHRTTKNQLSYRDSFNQLLQRVREAYDPPPDTSISLDDFIMLTPAYSNGVISPADMSIPQQIYYIFIVNMPDRTEEFLTKKTIEFNEVESPIVERNSTPMLERLQRFERSCFLSLRRDLAGTIEQRSHYSKLYFPMSYECIIAALMLQTLYPQTIYVEKNMIMTPYETVYNYLANGLQIISDEIDRSQFPSFIVNLRTFCVLEPVIDYSVALSYLVYGSRILNLTTSYSPIYYKTPSSVLDNDLFIFRDPFDFFVHVVRDDPGSYTDIIRKIYKKSGLIYYGELLYYDNYTIIRGIMN